MDGGGWGDRTPMPWQSTAVYKTTSGTTRTPSDVRADHMRPIHYAREVWRIGPSWLLPHSAGRLALRGCGSYLVHFFFALPEA